MIIKRVEKVKSIDCLYDSSNILASSYDKDTHNLTITFKGGNQYTYYGVKISDYIRFEIAESQGNVFNTHIKAYPFVKGKAVNTDMLITEIKEYTPKVLSDVQKQFLTELKKVVKTIEDEQIVNLEILDSLSNSISTLLKSNGIEGRTNGGDKNE